LPNADQAEQVSALSVAALLGSSSQRVARPPASSDRPTGIGVFFGLLQRDGTSVR